MSKATTPWRGPDRRQRKPSDDLMFRWMVGINVLAWLLFVLASWMFHKARPEFSTGVQQYWGLEARVDWIGNLTPWLTVLFGLCVALSVAVFVLLRKRARRRLDPLGANIVILAGLSFGALVWILAQMV